MWKKSPRKASIMCSGKDIAPKTKTSRSRSWESWTGSEDEDDLEDDIGFSEQSILGQFIAIFTFSFFIGLSLLHLSMIWQRIQYGESVFSSAYSVGRLMSQYYGGDHYDSPSRVDMRVNTTYFMH